MLTEQHRLELIHREFLGCVQHTIHTTCLALRSALSKLLPLQQYLQEVVDVTQLKFRSANCVVSSHLSFHPIRLVFTTVVHQKMTPVGQIIKLSLLSSPPCYRQPCIVTHILRHTGLIWCQNAFYFLHCPYLRENVFEELVPVEMHQQ